MLQLLRKSAKVVTLAAIMVILILFTRNPVCSNNAQRGSHSHPLSRIHGCLHQWVLQATGNITVDWSRFAYVQYATNTIYLCNAVMMFESLHRLKSKADRLLLYPSWMTPLPGGKGIQEEEGRLLRKARDGYGVKLKAVEIQRKTGTMNITITLRELCMDEAANEGTRCSR